MSGGNVEKGENVCNFHVQEYTWYYTVHTYDVVFVKAIDKKPCALGVVGPCTTSLPDHCIYVVHFNRNYCDVPDVPHEVIHMSQCCPMDANMNYLSEADKQHLHNMKEKDHVMNIYHRYNKLTLRKKAYVISRVLQRTVSTKNNLEIATDTWEQRNIFDLESTQNIKVKVLRKRKIDLDKGFNTTKDSLYQVPESKKKKKENATLIRKRKQKLLKVIRKAFSDKD